MWMVSLNILKSHQGSGTFSEEGWEQEKSILASTDHHFIREFVLLPTLKIERTAFDSNLTIISSQSTPYRNAAWHKGSEQETV